MQCMQKGQGTDQLQEMPEVLPRGLPATQGGKSTEDVFMRQMQVNSAFFSDFFREFFAKFAGKN